MLRYHFDLPHAPAPSCFFQYSIRSLILLSVFCLVIDVWQLRKWAFFFVVIGMNAITIYVAQWFIDFHSLGKLIFGRAPVHSALLLPAASVAAAWLFLYILYRSRIFLRL